MYDLIDMKNQYWKGARMGAGTAFFVMTVGLALGAYFHA